MRTLAYLLYWSLAPLNRRPPERPRWKNRALAGDSNSTVAMLSYGGLTANASITERGNAVALYRSFNKHHEVWLRNLAGHDGTYSSLCRARLWSWLADGVRALQRLRLRNRHRSIFLFGHSTGALVIVMLAWLAQSLRGVMLRREQKIAGVILIAPAFYLKQRSAAFLMGVVLLIYYLCLPLAMLLLWREGLIEGVLALLALVLAWKMLENLSIPSGETINGGEQQVVRPWLFLLLTQVLWTGLMPLFLVLLGPPRQSSIMLTLYCIYALSLAAQHLVAPYGLAVVHNPPEDSDRRGNGFECLPLMATAQLLPLQLSARMGFRNLNVPLLIILCEHDETVDNNRTERLCATLPAERRSSAEIVLLPETPHSGFSDKQNAAYRRVVETWLKVRIAEKEA